MNIISVRQFEGKSGPVKNQFIIKTKDGDYFQSYKSLIVFVPAKLGEKILLDEDFWDFSVTTSKYRKIFLGESTEETKRKIEDGTYLLVNLNEKK